MIKVKQSKADSIRDKLKDLMLTSTVHGIQKLARETNQYVRYIWLFFMALSISSCSYFIIASILNYISFEVTTKITTVNEQHSEFPTISICPDNNRFHINRSSIIKCEFNQNDCSKNFENYNDQIFGNCFRFNSGIDLDKNDSEILNSTVGGIYYSLDIDLKILKFLNPYDYSELAVYFHNKSSKPFILVNKGFRLSSGSINIFRIQRIFEKKLSYPYNNCYKDINKFNKNRTILDFFQQNNNSYSEDECIRYCRNLINLETSGCDCISSIDTSFNCTKPDNLTIKECYHNFMKSFQKKNVLELCAKYCPVECETISFDIQVYSEHLPSVGNISHMHSFRKHFKDYQDLQKKFFQIKAYYSDLKYIYMKQEAKMELSDLVSNIGGTFGLFLGISFLSFVEIFEIIFELFPILISK